MGGGGDSPRQYRRLEAEAIKIKEQRRMAAQDNTGGLRRTRMAEEVQQRTRRRRKEKEQTDKIREPLTEVRELISIHSRVNMGGNCRISFDVSDELQLVRWTHVVKSI